jgi:hypothetical protein
MEFSLKSEPTSKKKKLPLKPFICVNYHLLLLFLLTVLKQKLLL